MQFTFLFHLLKAALLKSFHMKQFKQKAEDLKKKSTSSKRLKQNTPTKYTSLENSCSHLFWSFNAAVTFHITKKNLGGKNGTWFLQRYIAQIASNITLGIYLNLKLNEVAISYKELCEDSQEEFLRGEEEGFSIKWKWCRLIQFIKYPPLVKSSRISQYVFKLGASPRMSARYSSFFPISRWILMAVRNVGASTIPGLYPSHNKTISSDSSLSVPLASPSLPFQFGQIDIRFKVSPPLPHPPIKGKTAPPLTTVSANNPSVVESPIVCKIKINKKPKYAWKYAQLLHVLISN